MKRFIFIASIVLSLTTKVSATSQIKPSVEPQKASSAVKYRHKDFAAYLGMTEADYHKFTGAYALDNASTDLPQFTNLRSSSAFIEIKNLVTTDQEVPESLIEEAQAIQKANQELFARYMGMEVDELIKKQDQFIELTSVINRLENKRTDLRKDYSSEYNQMSSSDDEVEVIVVTANEDRNTSTSSGTWTSLTIIIADFGLGLNGGFGARFNVDYRTTSGYYGTQEWYVDRFRAHPTGNVYCNPEQCSLNPF